MAAHRPRVGAQFHAFFRTRRTRPSLFRRSMKQWSANCGTSVSATRSSVSASVDGPAEPLADPVEQAWPARGLGGADEHGLLGHDHRPGDLAGRAAQRGGAHPDEEVGPVRPPDRERALPVPAAAGLVLQVLDLADVFLVEAERSERHIGQARGVTEAEESSGKRVGVAQGAVVVDDDHRGFDLVQDLLGREAERRGLIRPHRIVPRRGFAVCRHNSSTRRSGRSDNEHVRRDITGQRRDARGRSPKAPTVRACTCHPHTIVTRHKGNLATGLYPDVL